MPRSVTAYILSDPKPGTNEVLGQIVYCTDYRGECNFVPKGREWIIHVDGVPDATAAQIMSQLGQWRVTVESFQQTTLDTLAATKQFHTTWVTAEPLVVLNPAYVAP